MSNAPAKSEDIGQYVVLGKDGQVVDEGSVDGLTGDCFYSKRNAPEWGLMPILVANAIYEGHTLIIGRSIEAMLVTKKGKVTA